MIPLLPTSNPLAAAGIIIGFGFILVILLLYGVYKMIEKMGIILIKWHEKRERKERIDKATIIW